MAAVSSLIKRMGAEIKGLIKSAIELSYFSRGAWTYHDVLQMTQGEREVALDFINERLKAASKMSFPVF